MPLLRLHPTRRPLAAAVFLAAVLPSLSLFAGFKPDNTLEPTDAPDAAPAADASASAAPASSAPAEAVTMNYSGEIRRYPAAGGPAINGTLSVTISPLGKVTGSINWYSPYQTVKITGKQDLNTKQGDFVIRDASGARVPGAPRLPFRINAKNRLVGGGLMASGDASSFRLNRLATYTGGSTAGGATLSLGGSSSYSASSSTVNANIVNSGSFASNTFTSGASSGTVSSSTGGALINGGSILNVGAVALNLTGGTTVTVSSGAGGYPPTINADGNLLLGSTVLLVAPVTVTTGTDGTTTYTGKYPSGAAGTVIVLAGG